LRYAEKALIGANPTLLASTDSQILKLEFNSRDTQNRESKQISIKVCMSHGNGISYFYN